MPHITAQVFTDDNEIINIKTEWEMLESGILLEKLKRSCAIIQRADNPFLYHYLQTIPEVRDALKWWIRGSLFDRLKPVFIDFIIDTKHLQYLLNLSYICIE